jgi:7-cyano-7-deazaguanine synthase
MKKAIILLSGGLDSTTVLAIAKSQGYECFALSFDYGQRHLVELEVAKKIAILSGVKDHKIAKIDLRIFGGSSLTQEGISMPKSSQNASKTNKDKQEAALIPNTYVPARNTIFLSYALAYGETIDAYDVFIGANAVDYSGYPDCRSEFIEAFEKMANLATAKTVETSAKFKIHAPLLKLSKKQIIETGLKLGVDYSKTHSCYDPKIIEGKIISCKSCDSCRFRLKGFEDAGVDDKIFYEELF